MSDVRIDTEKLREYIREEYGTNAEFARDYSISAPYLGRVLKGERTGEKLIIQLLSRGHRRFILSKPLPVDKQGEG